MFLFKKVKKIRTIGRAVLPTTYVHTKHNQIHVYYVNNCTEIRTDEPWLIHIDPLVVRSFRKSLKVVIEHDMRGYSQVVIHCGDTYTGVFNIRWEPPTKPVVEILMTVW